MTTNTDTIHARIRRARAAVGIVTHDGKVTTGRTSYDYVSHQRLLAAVDPALDAEGLWHSQSIDPADGCLVVMTTIHSDNGESMTRTYVVPRPVDAFTRDGAPRNDLQAWGAAQSYGRRLGLMAALGLRDGSDEQAERYQRIAEPAAPADATADERGERIARLRAACEALGLDRDGLLRAIHDDTPSERLRHWLASGRDPVELTTEGWGVLMASVSALEAPTGIDEDMPL
jgi:PAS domain-containing protein